MIDKLYNLKKSETDQKLVEKGQLVSRINHIDNEIMFTAQKITTTTIQRNGAISDFAVLEIHKNTMKQHISKLMGEKIKINEQIEYVEQEIIELQKQTEQYKYILEEEKQEKIQLALKMEQEAADEFIQSKYITG